MCEPLTMLPVHAWRSMLACLSSAAMPPHLGRHLQENNLQGSIPASLGKLTMLQVLNIDGNHLTGVFPATIAKLRRLRQLDLSNNNFFAVPEQLAAMPSLRSLNLHGNIAMKVPASIIPLTERGGCPARGGQSCFDVTYDVNNVAEVA